MSQSDYIKYKRTSNELKYNDYNAVFNTGDYIDLKQYSLENSITNNKLTFNQLTPTGSKRIFNMEKRTTNCPTFRICKSTNLRTNRTPMLNVYFTPQYVPTYVKQPTSAKTACNCALNSVNTERYVCNCKTSF
jgi:hypothetical protein